MKIIWRVMLRFAVMFLVSAFLLSGGLAVVELMSSSNIYFSITGMLLMLAFVIIVCEVCWKVIRKAKEEQRSSSQQKKISNKTVEKKKTKATNSPKQKPESQTPAAAKRREKSATRLEFERGLPSDVVRKIDEYYDFIHHKKQLLSFDPHPGSYGFYGAFYTKIYVDEATGQLYLVKTQGAGVPVGIGCMCDQEDTILDGPPRAISYAEMLSLAEQKVPEIAQEYAGINETNWREYAQVYTNYIFKH